MANEFKIKKGLIVTGASGGTVVDIQGSQGQLFSVTDDLSGSIFAVSDISGVPILDVNSNGTIQFSDLGAGTLVTDASGNISVSSGGGAGGPYLPLIGGNLSGPVVSTSSIQASSFYDGYITWSAAQLNRYGAAIELQYTPTNASTFVKIGANGSNPTTFNAFTGEAVFTGNVGIGTTSPENKLHVQQSGLFTGIQNTAGIRIKSDGGSAIGNYHGTLALSRGTGSVAISAVQEGTDSDRMGMAFFTHPSATGGDAAVEQMRIDENGNVGIGTTSPNDKLEVSAGNIRISNNTPILRFIDTDVTDLQHRVLAGGNAGLEYSADVNNVASGYHRWDISNSEKMRLIENGNLGIGTTSPGAKLSVAGNVVLGEGMNRSVRYDSGGGNFRITPNNGGWATGYFFNNQSEGFLGGFGALGGGNDAFSYFWIGDDYNDTTMVIQPNAGNVGIGTTSPTSKIHVIGQDATFYSNTGSQSMQVGRNASERLETFVNDNDIKLTAYQDSDSNGGHGFIIDRSFAGSGANYFDIRKDGSTQMRINKDGNVGIGTTSPDARLDVDKSVIIGSESTATSTTNIENVLKVKGKNNYSDGTTWYGDYGQILLSATNNMTSSARQFLITNALDNNKFAIIRSTNWSTPPLTNSTATGVNSGTADFVIDNEGSIGIGTTSPGEKLEINTAAQSAIMLRARYNANYYTDYGSNQLNFTGTNQSFNIKNNGNSALFINASGNIGINGTSNSAVDTNNGIPKLQVNTSTALAGEFPLVARFTSGADAGDNSGVSVLINSGNDRGLMISAGREVGNVAKVTLNVVDNNGDEIDTITMKQSSASSTETNVGIGTTTPNAKLDVQGTQGQLFSVTDDLSGDIFSVADISGVPIMNVNSDGTSSFAGKIVVQGSNVIEIDQGTSSFNHVKVLSTFGSKSFSANNYGYILESSSTSSNPVTFRFDNARYRIFSGSGGEALTVLANKKVGINNTAPGYQLDVSGNARFTGQTVHSAGLFTNSTQTRDKISVWSTLSSYTIGMKNGFGYGGLGGDGTGTEYAMSFQMSNSIDRGWWWGDTGHSDLQGAMSLTTRGKLVVATSIKVGAGESTGDAGTSKLTVVAPLGGIGADFQIDGGSGFGTKNVRIEIPAYGEGLQLTSFAASSLDNNAITFYQDANKRGSIVVNATSTSYNTTSDYRLKENKEIISDAIERVKALKPVKFNWISEPSQPKIDGFYAHELAEVVPEAVTGEKDAIDHENNPDYQSIDQSKIVPLLSAALQQAIDKIEELEQRIQLIENK